MEIIFALLLDLWICAGAVVMQPAQHAQDPQAQLERFAIRGRGTFA